jgi:hypothetical protein
VVSINENSSHSNARSTIWTTPTSTSTSTTTYSSIYPLLHLLLNSHWPHKPQWLLACSQICNLTPSRAAAHRPKQPVKATSLYPWPLPIYQCPSRFTNDTTEARHGIARTPHTNIHETNLSLLSTPPCAPAVYSAVHYDILQFLLVCARRVRRMHIGREPKM